MNTATSGSNATDKQSGIRHHAEAGGRRTCSSPMRSWMLLCDRFMRQSGVEAGGGGVHLQLSTVRRNTCNKALVGRQDSPSKLITLPTARLKHHPTPKPGRLPAQQNPPPLLTDGGKDQGGRDLGGGAPNVGGLVAQHLQGCRAARHESGRVCHAWLKKTATPVTLPVSV